MSLCVLPLLVLPLRRCVPTVTVQCVPTVTVQYKLKQTRNLFYLTVPS